jgi:RHS repeat-associated protein
MENENAALKLENPHGFYPFGMRLIGFYIGQEYDSELDLHNFRARFYDSDLMRFYAVDPAMQTASPYLFCGNNPIMYVDEDGEFFLPVILGIIIGGLSGAGDAHVNVGLWYQGMFKGIASGAVSGVLGGTSLALGKSLGVSGVIAGGTYGAISGSVTGSIGGAMYSLINNQNVWEGARIGATIGGIAGGITGSITGGIDASQNGKNIWWGNKIAYNRNSWSFAWWDKQDVYRFPVPNVSAKFERGCFPAAHEAGTISIGKHIPQSQTINDIRSLSGKNFTGTSNEIVESVIKKQGLSIKSISLEQILDAKPGIEYVGVGVDDELYSGGHYMAVKRIYHVPNKHMKIVFMDPNGGKKFIINYSGNIYEPNHPNNHSLFWKIW